MKNKVLLLAALLSLYVSFETCAFAFDAPQLSIKSSDFVSQLEAHMAPLLKQYFPRAVVKKTSESYNVEFKAAKFATIDGGMLLTPKTDGIVFDVAVKPGKYKGKQMLPLTTNETLYYSILWVVSSPAENNHVVVRLFCPPDINISISDDLRDAVQTFISQLETSAAPKAASEAKAATAEKSEIALASDSAKTVTAEKSEIALASDSVQTVSAEKSEIAPASDSAKTATEEKSEIAPSESMKTAKSSDTASDFKASENKISDTKISNDTSAGGAASPSVTTESGATVNSASSDASDNSASSAGAVKSVATAASASSGKDEVATELDLSALKDVISSVSIPKFSAGTTPSANDNAFAPAPKTAPAAPVKAAVTPPKAPPKPSAAYFKTWFTKFYKTTDSANYVQDVLPFFSSDFHQSKLRGVERLNAAANNMVYKQFKKQVHIWNWSIEKAQPGPLGCWDVIVNGRTFSGHPAYLIYRMVAEGGTWRIDNARGRFWTSGSREL
ncbi:hypothetical protein KF913_18325 [Candidatus Obscuribacterales bacterium]|nr:hypothetical protein [Candidatus Obscuribacterales bacterium]